jgi:hypothetical protein
MAEFEFIMTHILISLAVGTEISDVLPGWGVWDPDPRSQTGY